METEAKSTETEFKEQPVEPVRYFPIDPQVKIITYTGHGYSPHGDDCAECEDKQSEFAARLLAFSKNTRLQMTPDGFDQWLEKPWEIILQEINYMATTIPSAWEMVDVTFAINFVSRACAQQITRTRNASYQMQSQRVTDMSEVTFHVPDNVPLDEQFAYARAMAAHVEDYHLAVNRGISLEDARGLLPMNVHCNLIAKYNLRALVELLRARDSLRVQGEYQEVARRMKAQVLKIWPWAAAFFVPKDEQAIKLIEEVASGLREHGTAEARVVATKLAKAADLLKK
jgi:flavin-dependent thymidylate synthase